MVPFRVHLTRQADAFLHTSAEVAILRIPTTQFAQGSGITMQDALGLIFTSSFSNFYVHFHFVFNYQVPFKLINDNSSNINENTNLILIHQTKHGLHHP